MERTRTARKCFYKEMFRNNWKAKKNMAGLNQRRSEMKRRLLGISTRAPMVCRQDAMERACEPHFGNWSLKLIINNKNNI